MYTTFSHMMGHVNSSAKENTVGNEDNTIFTEHPVHLQLDLYIVLWRRRLFEFTHHEIEPLFVLNEE